MKQIDWKTLVLTSMVCAVPLLVAVVYYPQLPERVATHFGVDGLPNGTESRLFAVIGLPLILWIVQLCLAVILDWYAVGFRPMFRVVKWAIPLILLVIQGMTIAYNLGGQVDYRRLVVFILAIVYLLIGNYMPKDVTGVEKEVRRTLRQTAYAFVLSGFVLLMSLFASPEFSIVAISVCSIGMIGWSGYCAYRGILSIRH